MKKYIAIMLLISVLASLLACAGGAINVDVEQTFNSLMEKCQFDEPLVAIDDKEHAMNLLKIDGSLVAVEDSNPQIAFANSAATPEMILIIKANSAADAKALNDGAVADWIKYYHDGYSDYGPDQVPKIDSAVHELRGEYIFLVISADNAAAAKTLNELIG